MSRIVFVTGFPGFIARRLVQKLLASDADLELRLLVEERQNATAERAVNAMAQASTNDARVAERVRILVGDVRAMDLGLSGPEVNELVEAVTEIHHLAAVRALEIDRRTAEAVNVEGTANMLALARTMPGLERFVHFSSAYVSGDRVGVIMEDDLDLGQSFRNAYEATKHHSERLVRDASRDLPTTIIRPAGIVGDSRTGEIDRFDSVYHLGMMFAASPAAVPVPLSGSGRAPLNMAPVDYVVDAVHAIAAQSWSIGRTFHVVDPNPLPVRRVYEAIAELSGRKLPRYSVPSNLAKALLRIPGLERLASVSHQAMDYLDHMAFYNSRNAARALEGTGISCPPFEDYVENLMQYVRDYFERAGRWRESG